MGLGRVSGQPCAPADYFTRLFVLAYAALIPFGLLSLLPDAVWLVLPLATVLAGVFVVMAVVGAANDEPMVGAVTDIPVHAICRDIERNASDALVPLDPAPRIRRRTDPWNWRSHPMAALLRPVIMRSNAEEHRPATTLELLFDLCFVVAVAALAAELHHDLSHDHVLDGAVTYALLFVPIWWAWMSYSWFATAFDNDDVGFRLLTGAQMLGVLGVAAAIPAAADDDYAPFTVAYTFMRLPLVVQWLRAAHDDPAHRRFAQRYAVGTLAAQTLWLAGLLTPEPARPTIWITALAVELGTPLLAVRASPGRVFHPGHITERYGLFTIIVLGETILAVSIAIRDSLAAEQLAGPGLLTATAALLIAFALWWTYFDSVGAEGLTRNRRAAFIWGYGHYVLFAALAAIGAATQAQIEQHLTSQDPSSAPLGVAVTVALLAMAGLQRAANGRTRRATTLLATAAATALVTLVGSALAVTATDGLLVLALAAGTIADLTRPHRDDSNRATGNHPNPQTVHP